MPLRSQLHLMSMGRVASNGDSPDFWPGSLTSMLAIGGPGFARIIVMPGVQCDRVRIYRVPTGQPLDKATHQIADVPCKPGVELQYVDGDPNIINVALSPPSVMERQWSRARFVDDFNRANAALNASPVASVGGSWVHDGAIANAAAVDTNLLKSNTADAVGSAYKTPLLGSADHWVSFKVSSLANSTTGQITVCCRLADRNNYIGVRVGSDGINVLRKVAGTFGPNIYGPAGPVAVNDIIRLEVQGTTYTLKRNGTVISMGPIGDAALTSGDTGVVVRNSAVNTIDEFQAGLVNPPTARYAHAGTNLDNRAMYSYDGINWISGSVPIDASLTQYENLAYSPELGLFCALANSGGTPTTRRCMTSPDGVNWTSQTTGITSTWRDICWGGPAGQKKFVAVGSQAAANNVSTSPDGINWTAQTKPNTNQLRSVCWSPELNLFVAVGDAVGGTANQRAFTSPDAVTWLARALPDNGWNFVCWGNGKFVAVASSGTGARVATSPDGVTWTMGASDPAGMDIGVWQSVMWVQELGKFVASCSSGLSPRVWLSSDGVTWTPGAAAIPNQAFNQLAWSPTLALLAAACSSGTTKGQTSPDGVNWTARANGPWANLWNAIAWGGNKFVAVGSLNGVNLELLTWGGMNLKDGDTVRYSVKVVETNGSIGRVYSNPGRNSSAQAGMVTGAVYMNATAIGQDADAFGFYAGTDKLAVLEDIVIYKTTGKQAPQGYWDYYVYPTAGIGIEADTPLSQIGVLVV